MENTNELLPEERTRLITYLSEFVTAERLQRIHQVIDNRTRYFTVVLEDIFQPHNASAVLRTCDACGVQDVHIIENCNSHTLSKGVELGTSQWLTRHRYRGGEDNTTAAISRLRSLGYRIIATTPHSDDVTPDDFDLTKGPAALMFGTELSGLSETALSQADEYIRIPMYGFVESYNISVSVAIILTRLVERLHRSSIPYHLQPIEREKLMLQYLRNSIQRVKHVEKRFWSLPQALLHPQPDTLPDPQPHQKPDQNGANQS
ncbi:MAG: TrmH family RNA methyltransferase [Spirochaeta sp.]